MNIDDIRIPYGRHTLKYPSHPQAETSQYGNGGKRNDIGCHTKRSKAQRYYRSAKQLVMEWKKNTSSDSKTRGTVAEISISLFQSKRFSN